MLVLSELEYLLLLLRSQFDVLQCLIKEVAALVTTLGKRKRVIQDLPESFRGVVLESEKPRPAREISEAYNMPMPLAQWYAAEAPFFLQLRFLRDGIAHRGEDLPAVYPASEGLAVDVRDPPWARTPAWDDSVSRQRNLGSLRRLFARLILGAHGACTRLANVLPAIAKLPEPVHPDLQVYLRSPFGHRLVALPQTDAAPWEGPVASEAF